MTKKELSWQEEKALAEAQDIEEEDKKERYYSALVTKLYFHKAKHQIDQQKHTKQHGSPDRFLEGFLLGLWFAINEAKLLRIETK